MPAGIVWDLYPDEKYLKVVQKNRENSAKIAILWHFVCWVSSLPNDKKYQVELFFGIDE
jgi:hypothetical protein